MPISKIKNFFSKNNINNCAVAVAFSGGTDSTALFHLLQEIKNEFNLSLFAIHVNYNLRADDSIKDQKFAEDLCKKYDVELFVKNLYFSNDLSGLEETARNERYKFFEQIKNDKKIKFIATAHNANDQAETLIFRLIRKTGIKGVSGILKFRDDGIIRPILDVTRSEILEYLTKNNFSWREDKSNRDIKFSRNRIRQNIIPELEKINPAATLHLAQFCEVMQKFIVKEDICDKFFVKKCEDIENIRDICFKNALVLNEIHCENIEKNRQKTGNILLLPNDFRMIVLKNSLFFTKNTDLLQIQEEIIDENIKKIIVNDFLKNDTKAAFERMKKAGLSKFERENSPAVFDSNGNLLAVAYCSWKFPENVNGFRWLIVKNNEIRE